MNAPRNGKMTVADLRRDIIGIDSEVELLDGSQVRYVFLDNAASTPTLRSVMNCIEDFMPWYSAVHRGTGVKAAVASQLWDASHRIVAEFVGADPATNCVAMVKNTTEAINKLAYRMRFRKGDIVLTTAMEHHSDDLPWRRHAEVLHVPVDEQGNLSLDALRKTLKSHKSKIKMVAVNGASNITGICNPIHDIAKWAHEAGAKIFVDAAQLAPHRKIDILPDDDPSHIDFIAFSAHKMYAPFGTGVLIGPKAFFAQGEPDMIGGGVVTVVTLDGIEWTNPPHKEEAGSPNVVGAIALAKAISVLQEVGLDAIAAHERELMTYTYDRIRSMKKLRFYGPTKDFSNKVGVVTFTIDGMDHALVSAIFGMEGGIGLRNGCFCAHPYVKHLLKISEAEDRKTTKEILAGNKSHMPGMVRASYGCYNNEEDVDRFVEMLNRIVRGEYRGKYVQSSSSGIFTPQGYVMDAAKYFSFSRNGSAAKTPQKLVAGNGKTKNGSRKSKKHAVR
ncbi:MAG TPA: aminotransferase class V-fold PLP-dependent enzyme [Bacteroidota bacterium]|nr:aminotransferase class V-fold PLP-dependent enzyme [Bacteroidota bacterium]